MRLLVTQKLTSSITQMSPTTPWWAPFRTLTTLIPFHTITFPSESPVKNSAFPFAKAAHVTDEGRSIFRVKRPCFLFNSVSPSPPSFFFVRVQTLTWPLPVEIRTFCRPG